MAGLLVLLLAAGLLAVVPAPQPAAAQSDVSATGAFVVPYDPEVIVVPDDWELIPDGLSTGDEFRLMFVTQERRDARSSDIADYDAFVQASAAGSNAHEALRAYAPLFKVLGSTSTVDARDHLSMDPNDPSDLDVPVYWVGGPRAFSGNARLFALPGPVNSSTFGLESVGRYAAGSVVPDQLRPGATGIHGTLRKVWTGTRRSGTTYSDINLGLGGSSQVYAGRASAGTTLHVADVALNKGSHLSFYGVSSVFRVGEPSLEPSFLRVETCAAGEDCGSGVVFVEEGSTATVRVGLGHEISSALSVTASSSDSSAFKVGPPENLWMGYRPAVPCTQYKHPSTGRLLDGVTAEDLDESGQVEVSGQKVTPNPFWNSRCVEREGTLVQTRLTPPASPRAGVTVTAPAGSLALSFDADDWAGYTSAALPVLHRGWREVVVHGLSSGTEGSDGVFDLDLTSMDSSVSLPSVRVVVTPRAGVDDPVFGPDPVGGRHCGRESCLTVAEGGTATYTVTSFGAPRDGRPLTVTPVVVSGSVSVSPASVSWDVGDVGEERTFTVTAADDGDRDDGSFLVRHEFSDNWDTNGGLDKSLQDPCRTTGAGGACIHTPQPREDLMRRFDLAGTVADDDEIVVSVHGVVSGTRLTSQQIPSEAGGTASFEIRLDSSPLSCAPDAPANRCYETLRISAERRVSTVWAPTDGVVTQVTFTVGGVSTTKPACEWYYPRIERLRAEREAAGQSTAGLTCVKTVTWDRPPFTMTVHGSHTGAGWYDSHRVRPNNWDTPVRVDLAMVSDFGSTGSYDIDISLTLPGRAAVRTTLPVSWGPGFTAQNGFVDPPEQQREQIVEDQEQDQEPTTEPDGPVEPAAAIGVRQVTDTTATIVWAPHGDGVRYQIGWYRSPGIPRMQYADTADTADTEHRITGLEPESGYQVFVVAYRGARIISTHTTSVTTLAGGESKDAAVDVIVPQPLTPQPPTDPPVDPTDPPPVVSVTAAGDVDEGSPARFTVTASPAPAADLDVTVTVTAAGDYGAATGTRTVTIAAGTTSATVTVATTNDSTDESDGSVTATLNAGNGYTVSPTAAAATAAVADDDLPPPVPAVSVTADGDVAEGSPARFTVTASPAPAADLDVTVTVTAAGDYGAATGTRTVTIAAGTTSAAFAVATAGDNADEADGTVTATLDAPAADAGYTVSSAAAAATVDVVDDDVPEISITAGAGVTEGDDATFTVTSDIAPHTGLDVTVTVTQNGDYGAAVGARTVTIAAGATSAALSVATADDSADEADGTVTATLDAPASDAGYTVSPTRSAATAAVADDDVPEISISAGNGVTEGSDATFTLTASPAPAADLDVTVTVSQSGDYTTAAGTRTVTIGATGSVTVTVATTNDETDETDGSITVTVDTGSGYTVSSQNAATVAVADDDPPVEPDDKKEPETELSITVEDASAAEGDLLVFRIVLSRASAEEITVSWNTATAWHLTDHRAHTSDYQRGSGTVTFAPGQTTRTAQVWTEHDSRQEADERFAVEAFLPGNWYQPDATATMTITDND